MKFLILILLLTLSLTSFADVERPPQFVALAFDGCPTLDRWEDTRAFAHKLKVEKNISLHFTYFLSSVFYLASRNKHLYTGPHHLAGQSDVGFGGELSTIAPRINETNSAFLEGHDIASHLNGHFDGSKWSTSDWNQEQQTFTHLIFNALQNNGLYEGLVQWALAPSDIVGFRAPYLAVGPGLWESLRENRFRYDTSETSSPDYWPDHKKGFWNFPLARVTIAGTHKQTLSMDYNFYVTQSHARDDLANSKLFEEQMYSTYIHYFLSNYNGNRAPVNIGHHFPLMNGGAYWRAMERFATAVCGLPEVRCVGYKELADFMDTTTPDKWAAFQKGAFPKLKPIQLETSLPNLKASLNPTSDEMKALAGDLSEAHLEDGDVASGERP